MAISTAERVAQVLKAVASVGLASATVFLPWATARSLGVGNAIVFKGGPLARALLVLAAATLVLSAVGLIRSWATADSIQIVVSVVTVPLVIALALTKIRSANSVASRFRAPSETAYGLGAVAALGAGGLILVTSVAVAFLSYDRRAREAGRVYDRSVSTGRVPPHLSDGVMRPTHEMPKPARWAMIGSVSVGLIGGLAGLVIGLRRFAPTAWFAALEVGIPSAAIGGLIGLASGAIASIISAPCRSPGRRKSV